MVTIDVFASLSMVKDELEVTLRQVQADLQAFAEAPDSEEESLKSCLEHTAQLNGVCRVIGLQGPPLLLEEMHSIIGQIKDLFASGTTEGVDNYLVVLGKSVMVLQQYLDYINAQHKMLPVLLIPSINEARRTLGKPPLAEDYFFNINLVKVVRDYGYSGSNPNLDELEQSIRRLRHMYQVGFLGVFRDGDRSHIQFIKRALERIDRLSGECEMGLLWWLALGVAELFLADDVSMNVTRLGVFGRVDRQIKRLIYEGLSCLSEPPPEALCKECLYIISLSSIQKGVIGEIKKAYAFGDEGVKDAALQRALGLISGPGGAVIDSVVHALKEELMALEDHLDLSARGVEVELSYFETIAADLKRVAHTLFMLGLVDISNTLKNQSDVVLGWSKEGVDIHGDAYHQVAHDVLIADNAITDLLRGGQPGDADVSGGTNISLTLLDEARSIVVVESRAGLAMVKKALSSYIEAHWDTLHLKNTPAAMSAVRGGLLFLQLDRAAAAVHALDRYIQALSSASQDEEGPGSYALDALADAMTSIDYYLEGLEARKPIGDGVLELAEESVKALGLA